MEIRSLDGWLNYNNATNFGSKKFDDERMKRERKRKIYTSHMRIGLVYQDKKIDSKQLITRSFLSEKK